MVRGTDHAEMPPAGQPRLHRAAPPAGPHRVEIIRRTFIALTAAVHRNHLDERTHTLIVNIPVDPPVPRFVTDMMGHEKPVAPLPAHPANDTLKIPNIRGPEHPPFTVLEINRIIPLGQGVNLITRKTHEAPRLVEPIERVHEFRPSRLELREPGGMIIHHILQPLHPHGHIRPGGMPGYTGKIKLKPGVGKGILQTPVGVTRAAVIMNIAEVTFHPSLSILFHFTFHLLSFGFPFAFYSLSADLLPALHSLSIHVPFSVHPLETQPEDPAQSPPEDPSADRSSKTRKPAPRKDEPRSAPRSHPPSPPHHTPFRS